MSCRFIFIKANIFGWFIRKGFNNKVFQNYPGIRYFAYNHRDIFRRTSIFDEDFCLWISSLEIIIMSLFFNNKKD